MHQQEKTEDFGEECTGGAAGPVCSGGGEPAGPDSNVTSKYSPTNEGNKGAAKWVEKQAKKKKSKNKKNK